MWRCAWLGALVLLSWGSATATAGTLGRLTPRIVGGSATPITAYPFQVALWSQSAPSPSLGQFCGGAIIDATHVATAAHCLLDNTTGQLVAPSRINVLAGTNHLRSAGEPAYPPEVKNVAVSATSVHPAYDPTIHDYDVGVLTMASALYTGAPALDGTTTIAPVPPISPGQAASFANPSLASLVSVSGWGDVNAEPVNPPYHPAYPQDLQAVQTHLVADSTCQVAYPTLTPRMICAGEPGKDSCFADSGGPLVVQTAASSPPANDVLVGIVSFGSGCAQAGFPGVYQRVANPELSGFLTARPPVTVPGPGPVPPPASPPPPTLARTQDQASPIISVAAKSCSRGRCVVNVRVTDPVPSSGIRALQAALIWKTKATCRRRGRRVSCTRTHTRHPSVKAIGGGHFLVSAGHLKRGSYTLTLVAVDKAGNRQRRPTVVALRLR
jgi:secreted trypsin-like serine protease